MSRKVKVDLSIHEAEELISRILLKEPGLLPPEVTEIEVVICTPEIDAVDVGIVIALDEEFREIFPQICATPFFNKEISQYYYNFNRTIKDQKSGYQCVVTFIGGMGTGKAALIGDRLMHQYRPRTIVNIGIAGSMDDEVLVGDVLVAEQADDYFYAARAVAGKGEHNFDFRLSGDPYKSSLSHVNHAKHLRYAHPLAAKTWFNVCSHRLIESLDKDAREKILGANLIRATPEIQIGNIASGPIVGTSDAFVDWLKQQRDRKYLALEMEAAGVLSAAHARSSTETLIIRGISDYSDARKQELDRIGERALRRYAMNNAIDLLWTYLDLRLISSRL